MSDIIGYVHDYCWYYVNNLMMTLFFTIFRKQSAGGEINHASSSEKDVGGAAAEDPPPRKNPSHPKPRNLSNKLCQCLRCWNWTKKFQNIPDARIRLASKIVVEAASERTS